MMNAYNVTMQDTRLVDMGFNGQPFTWCNNREGSHRIREWLDRAVANAAWIDKFPSLVVLHKLMIGSDHCPVVITLEPTDHRGRKQFSFEKLWLDKQECGEIVRSTWSTEQKDGRRPGIHDRLSRCQTKLHQWSITHQVNNKKVIDGLHNKLRGIQRQPNLYHDHSEEIRIKQMLEEAWNKEEEYWRHKFRGQWLKAGDINTRFFHQAKVERIRKNTIPRIQNVDGTWTEDAKAIRRECESYFRGIFQTEGCEGVADQLECMPTMVDGRMNAKLTKGVDKEEIRQTVFQHGGNKAPGTDDFLGVFYHRLWDVLGNDVLHSVKSVFETNILLPGYYYTDIILIPKVSNPINPMQIRPISLCKSKLTD